jgi:hypothetical protein
MSSKENSEHDTHTRNLESNLQTNMVNIHQAIIIWISWDKLFAFLYTSIICIALRVLQLTEILKQF